MFEFVGEVFEMGMEIGFGRVGMDGDYTGKELGREYMYELYVRAKFSNVKSPHLDAGDEFSAVGSASKDDQGPGMKGEQT